MKEINIQNIFYTWCDDLYENSSYHIFLSINNDFLSWRLTQESNKFLK